MVFVLAPFAMGDHVRDTDTDHVSIPKVIEANGTRPGQLAKSATSGQQS